MMSIDALVAPLLRVELFQGLSPLQLTEVARRAERIVFRPGDTITQADTPGQAAFLIVGGAAVWTGQSAADATEPIEIGSLIGEMAMLIEHEYGATIVATSTVRCLKLRRETMHEMMLEDRWLAQHLAGKMAARLRRTASALREIDVDTSDASDGIAADSVIEQQQPHAPVAPQHH